MLVVWGARHPPLDASLPLLTGSPSLLLSFTLTTSWQEYATLPCSFQAALPSLALPSLRTILLRTHFLLFLLPQVCTGRCHCWASESARVWFYPRQGDSQAGSQAAKRGLRNKKGRILRGFCIFPVTALGLKRHSLWRPCCKQCSEPVAEPGLS